MIECPGCGAGLRYSIESGDMECAYCGGHYSPQQFKDMRSDAEKQKNYYEAALYKCPQCGAELITADETDVVGYCSYCGGADLIFDRIAREKRPEYIIPFRITKEQCKDAYMKAAKRALLAPARYKKPELVDSFRGIYMPYWSFDVELKGETSVPGSGASYQSGDYRITPKVEVQGTIEAEYKGYAHDASKAFADDISECIAPFDAAGRQEFSPAYLCGFYADTADEKAERFEDSAREYFETYTARRINEAASTKSEAAKQGARTDSDIEKVRIPSKITKKERVMYPVWFMSYRQGDQITYATVNGQTGKVVADFPVSPLRFILLALLIGAAAFALLEMFFTLKPGWALAFTAALLLWGKRINKKEYKSICERFGPGSKETADTRAIEKAAGNAKRLGKLAVVGTVIAGMIILSNPVSNTVFYCAALALALLMFLICMNTFSFYKILAMRRPPQFAKKGADNDA